MRDPNSLSDQVIIAIANDVKEVIIAFINGIFDERNDSRKH